MHPPKTPLLNSQTLSLCPQKQTYHPQLLILFSEHSCLGHNPGCTYNHLEVKKMYLSLSSTPDWLSQDLWVLGPRKWYDYKLSLVILRHSQGLKPLPTETWLSL